MDDNKYKFLKTNCLFLCNAVNVNKQIIHNKLYVDLVLAYLVKTYIMRQDTYY